MNVNIETPALMLLASSLIKQCIIDGQRSDGKRFFRALEAGKAVLLNDVKLEDGSVLRVSLDMNYDEFRGQLNFSAFRNQLIMLVDSYARFLKTGNAPRVMSDQEGQEHVIFVPVISETKGQMNALVLGVDQRQAGNLRFRLMFVDPDQFAAGE
ncbi:hypothetical protein [Spongiibacter marinus]